MLEMYDQVEAGELLGGGKVLNAEQGQSDDNCDEERNYEDHHMTSSGCPSLLVLQFLQQCSKGVGGGVSNLC